MENSYKKFTRCMSDKRIAGVCSGIARYMEFDPTVIRIFFALSLLFCGLGFWAYLIIWLIAPADNQLER